MPERMSLAVLKVPPPHSSPDRRAASTSSALATLLICASSPLPLQMFDASFKAYSGPGYMHASGGALLMPSDFRGLASLLVRAPGEVTRSDARMRRALRLLSMSNPLVKSTLTCLEREFDQRLLRDPFPSRGGMGSLPAIPEDETQLPDAGDDIAGVGGRGGGAGGAGGTSRLAQHLQGAAADGARLLTPRPIIGAAQSVYEPPAAAGDERNGWQQQQLGTSRKRAAPDSLKTVQAAAKRAALSPDNAVHTTLFPRGEVWALRLAPPHGAHYAHSEMTLRPAFHLRRAGGTTSRMAQAAR